MEKQDRFFQGGSREEFGKTSQQVLAPHESSET